MIDLSSHYTSFISEMTLAKFKMRPTLLGGSMLKLDSTQVSDRDSDKRIL